MKITKLYYNWRQEGDSEGMGATYDYAEIGKGECVKIVEHQCGVEGDKWYYDIHHSNGEIIRTFNPNQVFYEYVKVSSK